jgi:hypothetical protein
MRERERERERERAGSECDLQEQLSLLIGAAWYRVVVAEEVKHGRNGPPQGSSPTQSRTNNRATPADLRSRASATAAEVSRHHFHRHKN